MKFSCIPHGLALAAALSLSSTGAFAASSELHALSESEMSDVYGRGLSQPTLAAFGVLTPAEQGNAYAAASANEVLAALSSLTTEGTQSLDRQMAQQRVQTATGLQILSPVNGLTSLPLIPFPLLFTLPSLPSLPAINNKH
jgi:hypothetical protein